MRPYIHPIVAPDGQGVMTQSQPEHHLHQTGLYWGFTRVNGRDYFHHPKDGYWKRVSVRVLKSEGTIDAPEVRWETVYDLLDESGNPTLREKQTWTMQVSSEGYELDLDWLGSAQTDVTIGKYDYGGLFLRMPWEKGMQGQASTQHVSRINARRAKEQFGLT